MSTETLQMFLAQRRELDYASGPVDAHRKFNRWVLMGSDWLIENNFPAYMQVQWEALGKSRLVDGDHYHDSPASWSAFHAVVKERMEWIARALEMASRPPSSVNPASIELLHPEIRELASSRLAAGNRADAVEAALKHVNALVKERVKHRTGRELDGSDLMNFAFSIQRPVIVLADLSTQSGKNEQIGYMQLFAGAMTGIRNPKAHANIEIDERRATHLLYLASLLRYKLDEAIDVADQEGAGAT